MAFLLEDNGMEHKGKSAFLVLLLWLPVVLVTAPVAGQPGAAGPYPGEEIQPRPFDRATWEKAVQGLNYASSESGKIRQDQANGPDISSRKPSGPPSAKSFRLDTPWMAALARLVLIAGGAAAAFVLLRALLRLEWTPRNRKIIRKKEGPFADLEKMEDDLANYHPGHYISQALEAGKYDLAIRLYYQALLKELSIRKLVTWKKGKTNFEYLRELRTHCLYDDFHSLTLIFERIWYGGRKVTKAEFFRTVPHFQRFLESLPPKEQEKQALIIEK